ncbi:unnamed protein product [Amoebophrya sp. A25]|nr:unnamed protein product [Amoebophrya sp. A25]|eukprot:GSA25T00007001001.1
MKPAATEVEGASVTGGGGVAYSAPTPSSSSSSTTGGRSPRCYNLSDFDVGTTLGIGAFGRVYFAVDKKYSHDEKEQDDGIDCRHQYDRYNSGAPDARTSRPRGPVVALKSLKKRRLIRQNQTKQAWCERILLSRLRHPFLVRLYGVFQSPRCVYFVLEFVRGGEFFFFLRQRERLSVDACRFYAGCIVSAFEYLHREAIVYRDLKPENVLIAQDGYLKLADFGAAKLLDQHVDLAQPQVADVRPLQVGFAADNSSNGNHVDLPDQHVNNETLPRTRSFVGTPEYIAPEILLNKGHGVPVDWWCLGVFLYEMLTGQPPIREDDPNDGMLPTNGVGAGGGAAQHLHSQPYPMSIYQKLLGRSKIAFPAYLHDKKPARDIIRKLLVADPSRRADHRVLKRHAFFVMGHDAYTFFDSLLQKEIPPPYIPTLKNEHDTSNFEYYSDSEDSVDLQGTNVEDDPFAEW